MTTVAFLEHLGDGSSVDGVTITANAAAHTKGTYVSLGTSSGACVAVELKVSGGAQNTGYLVEFGADEAGGTSYTSFCDGILLNIANSSQAPGNQIVTVPIYQAFASGTQFAARCQSTTGAATCEASIVLYSGTVDFSTAFVESLGADFASTVGVQHDPGAVGGTKGAWTELDASASGDIDFIVPLVQAQIGQSVFNEARIWVDIATGASSSESVQTGDIGVYESPFETRHTHATVGMSIDISSGTRAACRAASESQTSGRREIEMVALGFKKTVAGGSASGARNPLRGPIG